MTSEIKVLKFFEGLPVANPMPGTPISLVNQKFVTVEQIDSATSGANAITQANTASIMKMTNVLLTSVSSIPGTTAAQLLIWVNNTGNDVVIRNDASVIATDGILTGTGADLTVANGASVFMSRIPSLGRLLIVGGSGGGGTGADQKAYPLTNNQTLTDVATFILDSTKYTSYFLLIELERIGTSTFRQTIEAKAVYSGTAWSFVVGAYIGSDIIQDATVVNVQDVVLLTTAAGQMRYASGNLPGHTKSTLKVTSTGIKI